MQRLSIIAIAVGLVGSSGCNADKPAAGSSSGSSSSSGGPTGTATSTPIVDAGIDATTGCPPPPYTCESADAGDDVQTKTGAGGPKGLPDGGNGTCSKDQVAYATSTLVVSSPAGAFASTYDGVLGNDGNGPFAIRLFDFDQTTPSSYRVHFSGATTTKAGGFLFTETGADLPVVKNVSTLSIAATAAVFHLAFTQSGNAAGNLEVDGVALAATLDPGCGALDNVTVTLYVPSSQSGVTLSAGGPTIGSQLGAPVSNVGGLGFSGWAITLSAFDTQEIP